MESIGKIDHVRVRSGYHEGLTKGPDGEPVVTHLRSKHVSVMLSPAWDEGPKWPVIEPAKPVKVSNPTPNRKNQSALKTIVVISDVQVGFLRDIEDASRLVPMHDPAAINVALQVVAELQPDQLVYVGDFLDLPEMSRWLQLPEFQRTTQPAIDEGGKILAQFEAAAGPHRLPTQFIAGNHDRRLREYVVTNAKASYGIRPAQLADELEPPDAGNTIPWALRFKKLGIEYVGEYPGGEFWITPRLVVRHDPKAKDAYDASVIAGHSHHIKRETFTRRTPSGPVHHTLYEIGCLCSLENYGDKNSLMATRVPSNRAFTKDWAHGFAVVYVDEDGTFTVDQVEINNGKAIYRGKAYLSTVA